MVREFQSQPGLATDARAFEVQKNWFWGLTSLGTLSSAQGIVFNWYGCTPWKGTIPCILQTQELMGFTTP